MNPKNEDSQPSVYPKMHQLRELLKCPLDWVPVINRPFEGSLPEADWLYAVGAMAVDPDDIPFEEDWIDINFDVRELLHAVDVLNNRRCETKKFYMAHCAAQLHSLQFITASDQAKHYVAGLNETQIIARTKGKDKPSLFVKSFSSDDLRNAFWDWVEFYYEPYRDRESYACIMKRHDDSEEEYDDERAKLWRRLLSEPRTRICWRMDSVIGASEGIPADHICYDVHLHTRTVHCFPVTEAKARDIMREAPIVKSNDFD